MSENNTTVTKQETLAALRSPGELYVVMSAATKLPFVHCDDETYDDEVFLYYRIEDAKNRAKELLGQKYPVAVAKIEEKHLLAFYTSLYTMGVNCLSVNKGTDTQIAVQLSDLVARKNKEQLPDGKKVIENAALHLTAMYFMQEMRRQPVPQMTDSLKELQEEMLAHYSKGIFIIAMEEDGKVPVLQQKDGTVYQPLFTDVIELQKFIKGKKMKTLIVQAAKVPEILAPNVKGVVLNPFGVNVQLQIGRNKRQETEA